MNKKILLILIIGIAAISFIIYDTPQTPPPQPEATKNIAQNLDIPWGIAFLPSGDLLVTERTGSLVRIEQSGAIHPITTLLTETEGEGGLLGIALHPQFQENNFLYLYTTTLEDDQIKNEVVRYRFENDQLSEKTIIITGIPGAPYHDGGRIAFGPDNLLYITTGDATEEELAQDKNSLAGKILRLTDTGAIPEDNPFNTPVYSYGHRNPQGLTWDDQGRLWSTEHGRSGLKSGLDEINLIVPGGNYGWPESQGDTVKEGTIAPIIHSGGSTTWAPASALYLNGSMFFGGLRGETLYEAVLEGTTVRTIKEHFKGVFGRIRTVSKGPDGMIYITTSNTDGRGRTYEGDDKIIRIDPQQLP